jgi:hypothetical protein
MSPIFCDEQEYERCRDTSMFSFVIMASQDSKDIQISLHTSLSALSLHKDVGILDDTSSINSSFTAPSYSPRNSPAPTENGFTLHLAAWSQFACTSTLSPDDGRIKARKIFQKFVDVGKEFGLGDTQCVKMLEEAINVCNKATNPKFAANVTGADKVSQRYTRKNAPSFTVTLQGYILREIPIFNILEAMCWIYTCCIPNDEILADRHAERYLYQLLLIFKALKETKWLARELLPSTVAAAWNKPSNGAPLTVVFACSTVGKDKVRLEINAARRQYVSGLHTLVRNCIDVGEESLNEAGNCPEFVAWGALCRGGQEYRSLCLNIVRYMTYKCCTHCNSLAKACSEGSSLRIVDWYDKTILRDSVPIETENGYEGCKLKSLETIIANGRGR